MVDPVGKRDRTKLDGPVGKLCAKKNIEFVPCTFLNSGGISGSFDVFLIKAFAKDNMISVHTKHALSQACSYAFGVVWRTFAMCG